MSECGGILRYGIHLPSDEAIIPEPPQPRVIGIVVDHDNLSHSQLKGREEGGSSSGGVKVVHTCSHCILYRALGRMSAAVSLQVSSSL